MFVFHILVIILIHIPLVAKLKIKFVKHKTTIKSTALRLLKKKSGSTSMYITHTHTHLE